jgi:hypothetical protein
MGYNGKSPSGEPSGHHLQFHPPLDNFFAAHCSLAPFPRVPPPLRSVAMAQGTMVKLPEGTTITVGNLTTPAPDMEVFACGSVEMLMRPCVDCGRKTGRFCDHCRAKDRLPLEEWAPGQMTPLCSVCDDKFDACHFCRGVAQPLASSKE